MQRVVRRFPFRARRSGPCRIRPGVHESLTERLAERTTSSEGTTVRHATSLLLGTALILSAGPGKERGRHGVPRA